MAIIRGVDLSVFKHATDVAEQQRAQKERIAAELASLYSQQAFRAQQGAAERGAAAQRQQVAGAQEAELEARRQTYQRQIEERRAQRETGTRQEGANRALVGSVIEASRTGVDVPARLLGLDPKNITPADAAEMRSILVKSGQAVGVKAEEMRQAELEKTRTLTDTQREQLGLIKDERTRSRVVETLKSINQQVDQAAQLAEFMPDDAGVTDYNGTDPAAAETVRKANEVALRKARSAEKIAKAEERKIRARGAEAGATKAEQDPDVLRVKPSRTPAEQKVVDDADKRRALELESVAKRITALETETAAREQDMKLKGVTPEGLRAKVAAGGALTPEEQKWYDSDQKLTTLRNKRLDMEIQTTELDNRIKSATPEGIRAKVAANEPLTPGEQKLKGLYDAKDALVAESTAAETERTRAQTKAIEGEPQAQQAALDEKTRRELAAPIGAAIRAKMLIEMQLKDKGTGLTTDEIEKMATDAQNAIVTLKVMRGDPGYERLPDRDKQKVTEIEQWYDQLNDRLIEIGTTRPWIGSPALGLEYRSPAGRVWGQITNPAAQLSQSLNLLRTGYWLPYGAKRVVPERQ